MGVCALMGATFAQQLDPNRIVATVNGEEIKGGEYYYRMEYLPGVGKSVGQAFVEFPPGLLTLDQLITERLVFQLAKKKGVSPSDLAVQDEMAARVRANPNLVQTWTSTGRTADELKYQIKYELAKFNIQTAGVTVTDLEVKNYYTKNPEMFTTPKQVKLRVIVVDSTDEEAAVDKELKGGKSFADVASGHSIDATKVNGGAYGTVPVSALGTKSKEAIEKAKIGSDTDWIASTTSATATAYIKFRVEDVLAPKLQPYTDDLQRSIRRTMMIQRGSIANDIDKEMNTLRSQAKVDIKDKNFADAYQKFIAAYQQQKSN
jgi:foldase protein PrsA